MEIDVTGYQVFFYPNKKEPEFLIKGDVDLKDTKATIYKFDYGKELRQIGEEEANRIAKGE